MSEQSVSVAERRASFGHSRAHSASHRGPGSFFDQAVVPDVSTVSKTLGTTLASNSNAIGSSAANGTASGSNAVDSTDAKHVGFVDDDQNPTFTIAEPANVKSSQLNTASLSNVADDGGGASVNNNGALNKSGVQGSAKADAVKNAISVPHVPVWAIVLAASLLVAIVAALIAIVVFNGRSNVDETQQTVAYPRLAKQRMSDACVVLDHDALLTGRMAKPAVDLGELAASLRYHARAHGWRGMCAQHLADAPPVCFCILLLEPPSVFGKQGPPDSAYTELANMFVISPSEQQDTWLINTPFCGEQYVQRPDGVLAKYQRVGIKDGKRVVRDQFPYFEDELAVEVQEMDYLQHGADLCVAEPMHRFMQNVKRRMQRSDDYQPRTMFELSDGDRQPRVLQHHITDGENTAKRLPSAPAGGR